MVRKCCFGPTNVNPNEETSEIVVVDADDMNVVSRVKADSYPVGLAVSEDGGRVIATSQARHGDGGNSVMIFSSKINDGDE